MERRHPRCSPDHWRELLVAMNRSDDEVTVSAEAFKDVANCHVQKGGSISRDMVLQAGRSRTVLRRNQLWTLVQEHGKVCEMKGGSDKPADFHTTNELIRAGIIRP